jgi:hypothetical protein
MSKGKSKRKVGRNACKKPQQTTAEAMQPQLPDTSKTSDAKAVCLDVSKPAVATKRRFKAKHLLAVVTVLCLVASSIFGCWLLKPTQEQANEQKQANDRVAGRLIPRAEIIELIPARLSAELKPFLKPLHPEIKDDRGEQAKFVTFDDIHGICRLNPCVRLKNIGNEIIESVQIHVEELSIMPVTHNGPFFVRDPRDQKKRGWITLKPQLNPTETENCPFAEKFKPGDDAVVPIWRPLIRAILGAQVLADGGDHGVGKGPKGNNLLQFSGWNGQYQGVFKVCLYVRSFGATAPDRTENGPIATDFIWSARGFKKADCNKILDRPMAPPRVVSMRE